jgi:hypothetical protein
MNFEPFDTGLVVQRLREQVPGLHFVGGAADYAAVKELAEFRTPSAFVVFAEEENTGKVPTSVGVCAQESSTHFGVVLALRHYREQLGEQMHQDARSLIGAVRVALIGHKPASHGARVIGWQSGKTLDYSAGVLLFADLYRLHHLLHKD